MTRSICYGLNYYEVDDVIHDLYTRFLTEEVIEKYNPEYKKGKNKISAKISTYIYQVIFNHVRYLTKSKRERVFRNKISFDDLINNSDELDMAELAPSTDYETFIDSNNTDVDSLYYQIQEFREKFLHSPKNRQRAFLRSKDHPRQSYTLLEVFDMIYEGYTTEEIAQKYQVSQMTIFYIKQKLEVALRKFLSQ
jgi:DNA-binding CsgD family transcriptional regulator